MPHYRFSHSLFSGDGNLGGSAWNCSEDYWSSPSVCPDGENDFVHLDGLERPSSRVLSMVSWLLHGAGGGGYTQDGRRKRTNSLSY